VAEYGVNARECCAATWRYSVEAIPCVVSHHEKGLKYYTINCSTLGWRYSKMSRRELTTKTPMRLVEEASKPELDRTSALHSRSSLCCGSIKKASFSDIRNAAGSKDATSSRNMLNRMGASPKIVSSCSKSQRSRGTIDAASTASRLLCNAACK